MHREAKPHSSESGKQVREEVLKGVTLSQKVNFLCILHPHPGEEGSLMAKHSFYPLLYHMAKTQCGNHLGLPYLFPISISRSLWGKGVDTWPGNLDARVEEAGSRGCSTAQRRVEASLVPQSSMRLSLCLCVLLSAVLSAQSFLLRPRLFCYLSVLIVSWTKCTFITSYL